MLRFFRLTSDYTRLETVETLIYCVTGLLAVLLIGLLMDRYLSRTFDNKRRIRTVLFFVSIASIIPACLIPQTDSWRALQHGDGDVNFMLDIMFTSWHHSYLSGVLMAAVLLTVLSKPVGLKTARVLDTFALYLPLGLILIQCAFLVTGETWGRSLSLYTLGLGRRIPNPIPAHAIAMNLGLFFFLKRIHTLAYADPVSKNTYKGTVFGLFFLLYGICVLLLEYYGKEMKVLFNLTLTQYLMFLFVLIGTSLLAWIVYKKGKESFKEPSFVDVQMRKLLYLAGFVALTFALIFIVYYLIKHLRAISWPFRTTKSVFEAYERILEYLPMMTLPAIAFFFMKKSRMNLRDAFIWKRVAWWFYPVFAASTAYGLYRLFGKTPLKGWAYWPPALILCTMNALSEEFAYRFVFFRLLRQADYSRVVSHTAQAVLYALPHFILAGVLFGSMSFVYGLLMGILADKSESITPAVICHFIIDIGLIGNPLMRS